MCFINGAAYLLVSAKSFVLRFVFPPFVRFLLAQRTWGIECANVCRENMRSGLIGNVRIRAYIRFGFLVVLFYKLVYFEINKTNSTCD